MSVSGGLLLLSRGGLTWGVDNAHVSRVTRVAATYRVELGEQVVAADEILGVAAGLSVRSAARVLRRFWSEPFAGLTVHGTAPVVVVDPSQLPDLLLMKG